MTFEMLPNFTAFFAVVALVAVVGVGFAVAAVTAFVRENRPVRVARHESMRRYYGRVAFNH